VREVVLDTETTGLDPDQGHRVVEIGAIELENLLPTGRVYHQYLNPECQVPRDAVAVHGLTDAFLADKPVFAGIAESFLDFIGDARLVIHNAAFDLRMLNAELARLGADALPAGRALDTLEIARARFPGAPASLDALCRRFSIDNSGREKHGALLDSELLAEVYLELMGGRQRGLALDAGGTAGTRTRAGEWHAPARSRPLAPRLTPEEKAAHDDFVAELGDSALWQRFSD
jgi:DNA polymerase-3 subunit epsilon